MTHRAESIVSLIETSLKNITDLQVYRGKVTPIELEKLPAVVVFSGPEESQDSGTLNHYHFSLTVDVDCYAADSETQNIETALNLLKEQISIKLHESVSIHESVLEMHEAGSSEPEISDGGERQIIKQTVVFNYLYRRSRVNPGA